MTDPAISDLANKLAEDCIAVQREVGDDRLFMQVSEVIGASSQILEEAFLTAMRTRMANDAARRFLAQKLKAHREANGDTSDAS